MNLERVGLGSLRWKHNLMHAKLGTKYSSKENWVNGEHARGMGFLWRPKP
jgi:hypothetical protein